MWKNGNRAEKNVHIYSHWSNLFTFVYLCRLFQFWNFWFLSDIKKLFFFSVCVVIRQFDVCKNAKWWIFHEFFLYFDFQLMILENVLLFNCSIDFMVVFFLSVCFNFRALKNGYNIFADRFLKRKNCCCFSFPHVFYFFPQFIFRIFIFSGKETWD